MADAQFADLGGGRWRLSGNLDFDTVGAVVGHPGARLEAGDDVRVDLARLARTDSAGLALMVEWLREAQACNAGIRFENVPPQLHALARVCGLENILPLGGD